MTTDVLGSGLQAVARAGPISRVRRIIFGLAAAVLLAMICAPFLVDTLAHDAPEAERGEVSYAGWGPLSRPV